MLASIPGIHPTTRSPKVVTTNGVFRPCQMNPEDNRLSTGCPRPSYHPPSRISKGISPGLWFSFHYLLPNRRLEGFQEGNGKKYSFTNSLPGQKVDSPTWSRCCALASSSDEDSWRPVPSVPTPSPPPPFCPCCQLVVVIVRPTPGSTVVFPGGAGQVVGEGRPVSLGRWWVSVQVWGAGEVGWRESSPLTTLHHQARTSPTSDSRCCLLCPPSVPCAPAPSQNALCGDLSRLCSPHALLLYHSSNLMRIQQSLFMPVCIMVKILKKWTPTQMAVVFCLTGLEFLTPVAHCVQLARCPQEASLR